MCYHPDPLPPEDERAAQRAAEFLRICTARLALDRVPPVPLVLALLRITAEVAVDHWRDGAAGEFTGLLTSQLREEITTAIEKRDAAA